MKNAKQCQSLRFIKEKERRRKKIRDRRVQKEWRIAESNNQSKDVYNLFERIHSHCIYIMCTKLE